MLKQIFKNIAERREARHKAELEKIMADRAALHDVLAQCSDKQLVLELRWAAEDTHLYDRYKPVEAYEARKKMSLGLEVLEERVKADGLDHHPALAPIVRELAALPPTDMWNSMKRAAAVVNATKENPWRALAAKPAPAP